MPAVIFCTPSVMLSEGETSHLFLGLEFDALTRGLKFGAPTVRFGV